VATVGLAWDAGVVVSAGDVGVDYIEVAGVRVGFERCGRGPPLVLLHGLPGDGRLWRRQLDNLSDEFTVVAWDAPGCGRSSDPAGPFGLSEVAVCLARFIEVLELERPHVLGLSWGSGVALELYRIAPTIPRSLVLASGYAGWAGSLPNDAVAQRLDAYLRAARAPRDEALRGWESGLFSPTAPVDLVDEVLGILADFHPDALAALARSFAETDLRSVLSTIQVPTLVLHGDADTRSPLSVGHALHDAIPGAHLAVLAGVGHASNVQAPQAFNSEVRTFLRSVPP
jgi:pimeloyl-ACP methyl ester carboxylesterase